MKVSPAVLALLSSSFVSVSAANSANIRAAGDDPKSRSTLCHFDEEIGKHVKLSSPKTAANAHLKNHPDDLFNPPGRTRLTRTKLDANCEVIPTVSFLLLSFCS